MGRLRHRTNSAHFSSTVTLTCDGVLPLSRVSELARVYRRNVVKLNLDPLCWVLTFFLSLRAGGFKRVQEDGGCHPTLLITSTAWTFPVN